MACGEKGQRMHGLGLDVRVRVVGIGRVAVGAGGALVRAGDTFLTPEGAYVKAGDSFLKPGGGAVVRANGSYVGTDSALVKVGSGVNLILVGSSGASVGAGGTVLRPMFLPH